MKFMVVEKKDLIDAINECRRIPKEKIIIENDGGEHDEN